MIEKRGPLNPEEIKRERRASSDFCIGEPYNIKHSIHILHDSSNPTGFVGLPREWEEWIISQGITHDEMTNHPLEIMGAASFLKSGGPTPMMSDTSFDMKIE